jgi:hypothetical protein
MSTRKFRLSRRATLRGAGVAIALPWLEAMSSTTRLARAAAPKRAIFFFSPNGSIRDAWTPTGSETAFTLSRILKPLEPHIKDIVVLDGVDNVAATKGPGDDHMRGMGCMLTGTELQPGTNKGGCGGCTGGGLAGGVSVDQEMVNKLKPPTKFPSLELGVQAGSQGTVWGYSNYKAAGQPLPLENSAGKVFTRVFGEFTGNPADDTALMRLRMDRKSVLDAAAKHYEALNPKLGRDDKAKLDAHLAGIRDLEKRVLAGSTKTAGMGCAKPPAPAAAADFPAIGKQQMDLVTMAVACDLTRIATLQWSNSVGGTRFTWLGATRGHHDMSHDGDGVAESKEMLTKINVWYAEQFAYLISKLKAIPEEGGTALDNTVILWVNELARGNAHSHPDMPFVLAGRGGGKIKTGRYLKFNGTVPHNNLLVSMLNAMDIQATTFGNPAYCTGPLAGL